MDLDKDDLAVLSANMTKDEVDRVHRLLHEWGIGPEASFPAQLALLTRAQLRAAASVPRSIADSRKWLEQHLAEYRRQCKAMADDVSSTSKTQIETLKTIVENYAKATAQAAEQINARLADAEAVARQVKRLMDSAASEWKGIEATTLAQCKELEQVASDLQNRFAWRVILELAVWFSLVLGIGILAGHYVWTR
jgi:hypothetical protein